MTYKITRYRFGYKCRKPSGHRVIARGLTLEQAQARCARRTNRLGWFDAYTKE